MSEIGAQRLHMPSDSLATGRALLEGANRKGMAKVVNSRPRLAYTGMNAGLPHEL